MNKIKNKNRKSNTKKIKLFTKVQIALLVSSLMLFSALSLLVVTNNISWFDNGVYSIVSNMISRPMTLFFKSITVLCNTNSIIVLVVFMLLFIKNKKVSGLITTNIVLCVLLNQITKHIFLRPRPVGIALIKQGGYSFPSGHSMMGLALGGLLIYIIYTSKMSAKIRKMLSALLGVLILLIGVSRIYLGVHYASDVFAGFALALAYLLIFINLIYKKIISS